MSLLSDTQFIAALIAAVVAIGSLAWQRHKEKETLRHALFAELRHIRQHYGSAGPELPSLPLHRELEKRLKWSKYGDVSSVKNLGRFAILGAKEMQLLLQISLRIRNTDAFIDMLIPDLKSMTDSDLSELVQRMKYVSQSANALISYMEQADRKLSALSEPE